MNTFCGVLAQDRRRAHTAGVLRVGVTVFAGLLLVGCGSGRPGAVPTAETRTWVQIHAQDVRLMRGQAANVELVLNQPDALSYCNQLGASVLPVLSALPAPDRVLERDLNDAVSAYGHAAADCAQGSTRVAWAQLRAGDAAIRRGTARGEQLGAPLY